MFVAIRSKEDCSEALEAARRHSPNIEIVDEITLVFDLTGSKSKEATKIARELREKFEAVAVSENLAAALLLVRFQVSGRSGQWSVVGGEEVSTARGSERQSEPPAVAGGETKAESAAEREIEHGSTNSASSANTVNSVNLPSDDELFKIKKSEYRAGPLITSGEEFNARADRDPRNRRKGRGTREEGRRARDKGVQGSGFREGSREEGRGARDKGVQGSGFREGSREEGRGASEQTQNSKPKTQNPPAGSTGGRESEKISTACGSERQSEPPAVAGGDSHQFQVQGLKFKVKDSGFSIQEEQFKVQSSKFNVKNSGFRIQDSDSSEQTQNSKPKTQNPRGAESVGEQSGDLSEQTLNFEPGTLNTPKESIPSTQKGTRDKGRGIETLDPRPLTPDPDHLAALPLDAISRKAEFLELMDSWAIHDLGSFSQLPEDEMVERFGLEILELRKQAVGEAFRAVNWNVKEDKFFWTKELEGAIETIEPLNFVLSKGVAQIFRNLDHVGLSTQSAKITLRGRKKKKIYPVRLVFPTKNQKIWIRQIVTKIELDLPGFNIDRVEIEFRSTKPRTVQNNLYSGAILEPENLNLIVSKLKKVVGIEKIGLPKLRDSWSDPFYMTEDLSRLIREEGRGTRDEGRGDRGTRNPEYETPAMDHGPRTTRLGTQNGDEGRGKREFKVKSSTFNVRKTVGEAKESSSSEHPPVPRPSSLTPTFYYMPQPVKARVFFESGEPKALIIKGKRELVRTSGGPWRKDAEWYRANGWKRDEWDIETESGAVYRVFVDKTGEAFVDGGYD